MPKVRRALEELAKVLASFKELSNSFSAHTLRPLRLRG